jgi:hypothetical protein
MAYIDWWTPFGSAPTFFIVGAGLRSPQAEAPGRTLSRDGTDGDDHVSPGSHVRHSSRFRMGQLLTRLSRAAL